MEPAAFCPLLILKNTCKVTLCSAFSYIPQEWAHPNSLATIGC